MRKFLIGIILATLVIFSATALSGQQQDVPDLDALAAEDVLATVIQLWEAADDGDLTRYAGYLHPDYTVFDEDNVYLSVGKEAAIRSTREFLKRASGFHTEMHQPRVTIRGDVAWVVYYWTDSGEIDEEPYSSRGKSTRIFVREDGLWLCIHGHFTAVP